MLIEGTIQNGVVVFDPSITPLPEGTRVQIAASTGMEPTIRKTFGVCGGNACIRNTRIPVWLLASYRRLGSSEQELLDAYPGLTATDLSTAWAYENRNRTEIDRAIHEQEVA